MTTPAAPEWAWRNPFDYCDPTIAELIPFIGDRWAICRDTPANRERHGNCISRKQYETAQRKVIEARGWARPVEKVLRELLDCLAPLETMSERNAAACTAARNMLLKARER